MLLPTVGLFATPMCSARGKYYLDQVCKLGFLSQHLLRGWAESPTYFFMATVKFVKTPPIPEWDSGDAKQLSIVLLGGN